MWWVRRSVSVSLGAPSRYHWCMNSQPIRTPIRILGIDPGLRRTGWGVIES
ncbi:MAG: crossover junction endodeoxyribonuclease RuvC, partial [Bradyrhizobium sp.]